MLLGEHAVLHGSRALVCAINRRITVKLYPLGDGTLEIDSSLGTYKSPLVNLQDHPSFKFVIQAVTQHRELIPSGLKLRIESDFSAEIGFGSSAAVTVATHAALMTWVNKQSPDNEVLFAAALQTVHAVQQGRGSGSDLVASVFGGAVSYHTAPDFLPVPISVPITAVYCGYKTPTPEVIRLVEEKRAADPDKFARIYAEIDASIPAAIDALRKHDLPAFGNILNTNQQLMIEMGVNTPELQEITMRLQRDPDVFGAKISGSGLGDCAVGVGYCDLPADYKYPVYHLVITSAGCLYHD